MDTLIAQNIHCVHPTCNSKKTKAYWIWTPNRSNQTYKELYYFCRQCDTDIGFSPFRLRKWLRLPIDNLQAKVTDIWSLYDEIP